jgi:methylase of polypeptide subunit release factors
MNDFHCVCRFEDLRALDGGADGLSVIEPIIAWSSKVLSPGGQLFLEVDPCHSYILPDKLKKLEAERKDFRLKLNRVVQDFRSIDRFILFSKEIV